MRMEFPISKFSEHRPDNCPYRFQMPDYFSIVTDTATCYADIEITRFNATLYLTYLPIDSSNQLLAYTDQARRLVYDHSIMADGIEEVRVENALNKTYGLQYHIAGDAATLYQFYLTDSLQHFMRGALVFNTSPNYDSLMPSLAFITRDLDQMINSVQWSH